MMLAYLADVVKALHIAGVDVQISGGRVEQAVNLSRAHIMRER
jgi:hypothetical protein